MDTDMNNVNKVLVMIKDNIEHKKIVLDNCLLIAEHLIKNNDLQLGLDILRRGCSHDNSKFEIVEFYKLVSIISDKTNSSFTNPESRLSIREANAVKAHWSNNSHHPEYHEHVDRMSEVDIVEMVCDWYARSKQYGTDFMSFVNCRQKNRFNFSEDKYKLIEYYCNLIKSLDSQK